jgi:AsmA family
VRHLSSRRGLAAIAALLLILFLFRPGVYGLRNRIATSIGNALGRRVSLGNVRLRVLPRPGFDLEGLVIYDDPAFSAEPMIRAQEVSAPIRFRSLLSGRLEIATLSANEPSINLVRNDQGRWNLASLLERNAQIPAAPTGKPASERRPAFPYLEAVHARINFKIGQTKKSYALMDADVALWQDSENSWGARIKAAPVRTDFNLTDTGLLRINATWQRASALRLTPLQLTVQWQKGQLGQITKLLSGKDRGWRGGVDFAAHLSGTPEALLIQGQTAIDDFRRYDIVDSETVRLATSCSGQYNAVTSSLGNVLCESPISGGTLRLRGTLSVSANAPDYDLTLQAERVPMASLVRLLRQAKKQIPGDLIATGALNAEFRARRNTTSTRENGGATRVSPFQQPGSDVRLSFAQLLPQWTGSGLVTNVRLSSNAGKDQVALGTIPLTLVSAIMVATGSHGGRPSPARPRDDKDKVEEPAKAHLRIGPAAVVVNAAAPFNAGGWISTAGYRFFLRGDVELQDLFRLENALGLPVPRPAAEGSANLDMSLSGPWQGFAVPTTLGTAQLRNVRAEMYSLNTPIEIASAAVSLDRDVTKIEKISARIGGTHWSGGVAAPRHCTISTSNLGAASGMGPICVFQFDLTADQLSTADLTQWFQPHQAKRPWYRILNSNFNKTQGPSPLLAIQAHGDLHVGRFGLKKLLVTQVATHVDVDRGKITLASLHAQLLRGAHRGDWVIDANREAASRDAASQDESNGASLQSSTPPVSYHGKGTLQDVSLEQMSMLMNDGWITGTADGNFDVSGSAESFGELAARSDGKLQFVMRNGGLPHVEIPGSSAPLPVHRFSGDLRLEKGTWQLSAARLESHDGIYQISGTVSPDDEVDFVLKRGDDLSWTLTGTLADPQVVPVDRTEAERATAEENAVKP